MKVTIKTSIIAITIISCLTSCGSGGIGGSREEILETIKLFPVKMGNEHKYCYVDKTGKVVIEGNYDYASLFYEGIAAVYPVPREVRYINEKGEFITPDVYAKGTPFSEGIAFVQIGTRICDGKIAIAINTKGEQLFKINTEETGVFREGLAAFRSPENGKWGFVNKKGEVVIPPTLGLSSVHFSHGKLFVRGDNNKWGVINAKGEQIIDYKYEKASEFDENDQAVVLCEGSQFAIIDNKGNYVLPPQSDYYFIESDGDLYRILNERKAGWLNKDGKVIIEPIYEERGTLYFSGTDQVYVTRTISESNSSLEQEHGYINRKGEMVLKCEYSDFNSPFMGDVAIIGGRNYWFINKKGERVSETFNDIGELRNLGHAANGDRRYTWYRW